MPESLTPTGALDQASEQPPVGEPGAGSDPQPERRPGVVARVLTFPLELLVLLYQRLISPLTPPTCRFYPSCSAYALTALRRHGPIRGTWLAVRRLLRCHPWNPGGVDHVPPTTR